MGFLGILGFLGFVFLGGLCLDVFGGCMVGLFREICLLVVLCWLSFVLYGFVLITWLCLFDDVGLFVVCVVGVWDCLSFG